VCGILLRVVNSVSPLDVVVGAFEVGGDAIADLSSDGCGSLGLMHNSDDSVYLNASDSYSVVPIMIASWLDSHWRKQTSSSRSIWFRMEQCYR
jgi:hypothetical protein